MSNKETNDKELKLPWSNKQPWWLKLLIHIGLVAAAGLLFLWGAMLFLNLYTRHGKAIETPDIVGLSQEEAAEVLDHAHLNMAVSYTHLTLPTILRSCRSRWSPYH